VFPVIPVIPVTPVIPTSRKGATVSSRDSGIFGQPKGPVYHTEAPILKITVKVKGRRPGALPLLKLRAIHIGNEYGLTFEKVAVP